MQISIEDCEVKIKCIIGGDCTFTHLEKHEIIKGYLEYEEEKNMKYFINYGTGAGNFEIEGTLADAKRAADEVIMYTQRNVTIEKDEETVSQRTWYGCEATVEDREEDIIDYGTFGFYSEWIDL